MTITHVQTVTGQATSAVPLTLFLGAEPGVGSALIAAVAIEGTNSVTAVRASGASWNLLYEAASAEDADEVNGTAIRAQLWGAFDVAGVGSGQAGFVFSGGTVAKGIVMAEYSGDVFEFPNPADRIVGSFGTSAPGTTGPADTGAATNPTRENVELWVAAAGVNKSSIWSSAVAPFAIRDQIAIPPFGAVCLLDYVASATGTMRAQASHAATGSGMPWAITAAAIRGDLQVPADVTTVPAVSEPVTEQEDYSSNGIEKLASQFRARS